MNEQVKGRKMPEQKPGRSVQDVGTPRWLLDVVERTWGTITYDPAASIHNHACPRWSDVRENGLATNWISTSETTWEDYNDEGDFLTRHTPGLVWVNPPYERIGPWVAKASTSRCLVVMLVPASVGSNWWKEHVHNKAAVYFLSPRLVFKGHTQPYPKDLALLVYGAESPRYRCVRVQEGDIISKGPDDILN